MLFVEIFGFSILFLIVWACDIFGLSDVWGASGLSFSCLGIFVIGQGEANFVRMIS
jgi:hypothetical protein